MKKRKRIKTKISETSAERATRSREYKAFTDALLKDKNRDFLLILFSKKSQTYSKYYHQQLTEIYQNIVSEYEYEKAKSRIHKWFKNPDKLHTELSKKVKKLELTFELPNLLT